MAERFIIEGLGGAQKLSGEIAVKGAKNAVLKSLAASILFGDTLTIDNVPAIEDVAREVELLQALGAQVEQVPGRVTIDPRGVTTADLDDAIARKLRASIVFAGPLLARFGKVSFPHPGGDVIGPRPINLFLEGFAKMGAEATLADDRYTVVAKGGNLRGAEIFFMFVSVTATETLMMAAVGAEGKTTLKNAAMEPEIVELANFLNKCGAKITGAGTPTIQVEGGGLLRADGKVFTTIPDRIETGTFLLLGALAGKEVTIRDCDPSHVDMLTVLLRESGVAIETAQNSITVRGGGDRRALNIRTHEYPGFATDMQPPMVVYLTQCSGESTMFETIWGGRLNYTQDLVKMGADITLWNPQQISVKGPTPLQGRELESPDIRAGLAFLMAATVASGESVINNIYHIDRGYERIEERLAPLGLQIRRVLV